MNSYFRAVDGTAPSALLYEGEELLASQESVGLYDGEEKTQGRQDGTVMLTTHRLFYIDVALPKLNSLGLNLSSVKQTEFYAGFLTSSPKITLLLKLTADGVDSASPISLLNDDDGIRPLGGSWVCPLCSYRNLPSANEGRPVCGLCGVPRDNRAYVATPESRRPHTLSLNPVSRFGTPPSASSQASIPIPAASLLSVSDSEDLVSCSACTYLNHPSMRICEMCDTVLPTRRSPQSIGSTSLASSQATTPKTDTSAFLVEVPLPSTDVLRISFRKGGAKSFYNTLKKALLRKAWMSEDSGRRVIGKSENAARSGIQGILDTVDVTQRAVNSNIDTGLRDLEALMIKAKEMVELASSLNAKLTAQEEEIERRKSMFPDLPHSAVAPASSSTQPEEVTFIRKSMGQLGLPTMTVTQDMVKDEKTYHEELARELAVILNSERYLSNGLRDAIIPLDELWKTWNRARGVALVPPSSLIECVSYLPRYTKLPMKIRTFRSGAKVLQTPAFDENVCSTRILSAIESQTGTECTTVAIAEILSMPIGLVEELIEDAETGGFVVRDEGGTMGQTIWYPNEFGDFEWDGTDERI
ncbi:EAP30/Vps36 family-domain-containing protein [Cantharellus anzutake]|uniref:EAP30/Vps36 family-domain-containing protein n=1 Tax=Cantharellus anzutake TaxID=1750568 RepID=UPI0019053A3A|nr:EAP30/Vps36 family-domain-containing protein [Cantharellus anzutake]XP_038921624.1 EAP30/Vps36 family-domain-containing protein [Cantharellus anzutake]KAF8321044.1 EAP30/Vps36 family-domain-containing protein [Cantharellus anzutake]KAF8340262.1 EAP30/Vps36 family-domain-containing protein [Cantharellus anzutake]